MKAKKANAGQKRILSFAARDNRRLYGIRLPPPEMVCYELRELYAREPARLVMKVTSKMVNSLVVAGWLEPVDYTEKAERWRYRVSEAGLLQG
jgi:hypothetical protein